jgi:stage II sporulation protein D
VELRVLVADLGRADKIEISGVGVTDDRGEALGESGIICRVEETSTLAALHVPVLRTLLDAPVWYCANERYRRAITGPVTLRPKAGFLEADKRAFRNALTLVPRNGRLAVINPVPLEHYLAGLVNREISSKFPPEAVKAQVVAARSYALAVAADRRRLGEAFDVHGTVLDQVYEGAQAEDGLASRLVHETEGELLLHREDVLKAYYHAASGGYSELPQNVWAGKSVARDALAFLARPSEADEKLNSVAWTVALSPKFGLQWPEIGLLTRIEVLERSEGKRVMRVRITGSNGDEELSGAAFRQRLGNNWIKSTYFTVRATDTGWIIEGRGHGHGVGMSQLGAKAMAQAGKSYAEILRFYYPFSTLRKVEALTGLKPAGKSAEVALDSP